MVPSIDGTCPKVSALRGREFRFMVPPQARWLFFGNSFMGETFNALLAGLPEDLTETSQQEGKKAEEEADGGGGGGEDQEGG